MNRVVTITTINVLTTVYNGFGTLLLNSVNHSVTDGIR